MTKLFVLLTGESILGEVTGTTPTKYVLKNPVLIQMKASKNDPNKASFHFLPLIPFQSEKDREFTLHAHACLGDPCEAVKELVDAYEQMFSPIVKIKTPSLIIP
jgi:hypothetical protein